MILDLVIGMFCTLVIAAGWYYLARSTTVEVLSAFESPQRNRSRRGARRLGAWSMIVLSLSFFWMVVELRRFNSPSRMAVSLTFVCFALMTMMFCAFVDVYLTYRMRQTHQGPRK